MKAFWAAFCKKANILSDWEKESETAFEERKKELIKQRRNPHAEQNISPALWYRDI